MTQILGFRDYLSAAEFGVMNTTTMREFDARCPQPVRNLSAAQIKRLRMRNKASQTVFAAYLNTSPSTVQKSEQGQKKPNRPSLKLLKLIARKGLEALVQQRDAVGDLWGLSCGVVHGPAICNGRRAIQFD